MGEALLAVENLAISFATAHGPVDAVKGVSFTVERGEALGIVGESGSGKSVLCRALLKLLATNATVGSGRILHEGRDVLAMSPAELGSYRGEKAAMIFQNPSTHLDPIMAVGDQVAEGLVTHRQLGKADAGRQAVALLEDMKIVDAPRRARAYPHELSGGMRQRVMIAAALACSPELLIADEPTTALDVTVQAQILELIRRLRAERRLTLVLVSHDLGVIGEMCDRIIVMKDGRIVETGSTRQILIEPKAEYTRNLINAQPSLLPGRDAVAVRDADAIVTVDRVSVHFPAPRSLGDLIGGKPRHVVRAVDDVSFTVRRGGSLGIVGESGSGKSTLARAMVGLTRPTSGHVAIGGVARPADRARIVQMAFQDPYLSLNPAFTVGQTLSEPFIAHHLCAPSEVPARIRALMRTVELPEGLLSRRSGQLSGGQRQRVGIARALAMQPRILIADEVTSALDVSIQAQILALFRRLQTELDLTLILISHDLAVVRYLCEDVLVMRNGKVVEHGPSRAVLRDPQTEYTRALLDAVPKIAAISLAAISSRSAEMTKPRARDLGLPFPGTPGTYNAITDVPGVLVGSTTLIAGDGPLVPGKGPIRTGVTAILPFGHDRTPRPVTAGFFALNGNGEMTGVHWVNDAGYFVGPVCISNTHAIGAVHQGAVEWMIEHYADLWHKEHLWAMPVIAETYDGVCNDINGLHVKPEHAVAALKSARTGPVAEGNTGGGTAMVCYEFKGGTGTSSRRIDVGGKSYHMAALVQANHGERRWLSVLGVPVGQHLTDDLLFSEPRELGSIIVILATDIPMLPHQLRRIAKRAAIGIGRNGTPGGNNSGDIFLAFSVANKSELDQVSPTHLSKVYVNDEAFNPIYEAAVQSVEEAVINAMVAAEDMTTLRPAGKTVRALPHGRLVEVMRRYGRITG